MSCDTCPRLGEVWLQWLVKIWVGSGHPQALHRPGGGGGCSSFIECLGKRKLWVQNACSVTPEVDRKKKKRGFLKFFNALNFALDLVLDP